MPIVGKEGEKKTRGVNGEKKKKKKQEDANSVVLSNTVVLLGHDLKIDPKFVLIGSWAAEREKQNKQQQKKQC